MAVVGRTVFKIVLFYCLFIVFFVAWVIETDLSYLCTFSCLPSLVKTLISFEAAAVLGRVVTFKGKTFNKMSHSV